MVHDDHRGRRAGTSPPGSTASRWWTGPTIGRSKDNARNGCRLEKGPISLQGHDPTTDLSFRNIRIEDLTAHEMNEKKP